MLENYFFSDAAPVALGRRPAEDGRRCSRPRQLPAAQACLVLDAGVDLGLVRATRDVSAFVGMTVMLADFWDTDAERAAKAR